MNTPVLIDDDLLNILACSAITPGLRSVLVYDVDAEGLLDVAAHYTAMLRAATQLRIETVMLGSSENDEHVWGTLKLQVDQTDQSWSLIWQPGLLEPSPGALRLVLIPDLARLSLAASRACVSLIETDLARLERSGAQRAWVPDLCWFAACHKADLGRVSPHLLDRFALRFDVRTQETDRVQQIHEWLAKDDRMRKVMPDIELPHGWDTRVREASHHMPAAFTDAVQREMATLLPNAVGARRDIALVRLAGALARLNGAEVATDAYVREAARLTSPARPQGPSGEEPAKPAPTDTTPQAIDAGVAGDTTSAEIILSDPQTIRRTVFIPDSETNLPGTAVLSQADPTAQAEAQREWAPLRPPPRRYRRIIGGRGDVVGVRQTDSLYDLAVFQTLIEAQKFQPIRRKIRLDRDGILPSKLVLSPTDLRGYLRVPVVEQMLMVVIDFTSLGYCDWQTPLSYYLGRAYVERMSVGIVRVGARETPGLLRADRLMARNLLDLRVYARINSHPGHSTPLAHGLDLAYDYLRGVLQRGRQAIDHAALVVISDGRGNVPLESSRSNQMPTSPIGNQGIEDSLAVARDIHHLKGVDVVFLKPPTDYYPQLIDNLAQALGTMPIPVELPDEEEPL